METLETLPHELAEGFVVGELPVVLLCEGMINILQAPVLGQLGRALLLHRLLKTNQSSEPRAGAELGHCGLNYLCCFLLAAVAVPIVFFLLLGFLLLPFFMFLLFLLLSGPIVAG